VCRVAAMSNFPSDDQKIEFIKEYFRRVDAGRPDLTELFHEDAVFYFPKFGIGRGRDAVLEMAAGFAGDLERVEHDFANYLFIAAGSHVAVEGTTKGRLNGKSWEAGKTPGGRFCNIFEFRGDRFARVFVYLDPDYTSEDEPRFRWGRVRAW
jgi:hypothetical protein